MNALLLSASLLLTSTAFAENGLAGSNGFFNSVGGGLSPIYIEEVYDGNTRSGGAFVTAFNGELRAGMVFKDEFAGYALTSQNVYLDGESQIYTSGLTGLGAQYFPSNLFDVYVLVGAGLASKIVFQTDRMASATGLGWQVGIGRAFSRTITLEANYKYLSLSKPALTSFSGDSETVNSVQFSLHYLMH